MLPTDVTASSPEKKYSSLISKCITTKSFKFGKALHCHLIKTALFFDPFLTNGLIDVYSKCCCVESAEKAFDDLPNKTTRSWNTLISLYSKMCLFDKAYNLFDKMPHRNLVSYNSLISGSTRHGFHRESISLFRMMQMDSDCLMLDEFTLISVVGSCASLGNVKWLHQVHGVAVIVGIEGNMILSNALIDAYGKCGKPNSSYSVFCWMQENDVVSWTSMVVAYARASKLDEACRVFHNMPFRNTISWTALITGFARNRRCSEALNLFKQMLEEGVNPNAQTFVSVLGACADEALIGRGKEVHGKIIRYSNSEKNLFNVYLYNALIDMYGKCGDMKSAEILFEMAPMRDLVSWNTLITGFAQNGYGHESMVVFRRMMIETNMKPNYVTFLGVISGCSHAGLVHQGLELLDLMEQRYSIKPSPEHYALLIDLLGRKNRLKEAVDLIEKTPSRIRNHIAVWGAVLGACRVHGNLDLARRAAEALFELEPENTARYVMLSNIYAASGKFDDADKIRRIMKEKGLKKEAAHSWIELRDARHEFVAKDKFHPQIGEICEVNNKLVYHLKDAGYQPFSDYPLLPYEDDDFYFSI
ncbi:hypothetical protein HN51_059474 [Arachis hypogaea]|uniref:Pentatricopeptide repeat-containing protein n=1 Tax=Arachis hypogaea TaxID=3818 RepID=A0A444X608_ARAHY|nr:pentatricopeptide repeat-containing protein At2g21090-like [Arachis ipaensis]XP_025684251.1 pentatricopeptide repeat-containing protein At2g21090-like [Arachis hypogaea]RYQ85023.1 hypothetical protein Ahy_B10g104504 [Arachis hypogaea]